VFKKTITVNAKLKTSIGIGHIKRIPKNAKIRIVIIEEKIIMFFHENSEAHRLERTTKAPLNKITPIEKGILCIFKEAKIAQ